MEIVTVSKIRDMAGRLGRNGRQKSGLAFWKFGGLSDQAAGVLALAAYSGDPAISHVWPTLRVAAGGAFAIGEMKARRRVAPCRKRTGAAASGMRTLVPTLVHL